jgi:hypothetical protein
MTTTSDPRAVLADRVRACLPASGLREVRMFGGIAFLREDRMLVCVARDGGLLVRVAPARDADLMTRPGTGRLRMGSKQLDTGWILVDPSALDDAGLGFWLDEALVFHADAAG